MSLTQFRSFHSFAGCLLLVGVSLLAPEQAQARVQYSVVSKTYDYVNATVVLPGFVFAQRKVRQGSFGAPAINDKGSVAYPCILSGKGLGALTNNSIILRQSGRTRATMALQAGFGTIVSDSFLPTLQGNSKSISQTGRMYRFGVNVALNNKNRIAFTGQLLYRFTSGGDKPTISDADTAVYGLAVPTNKRANVYRNVGLNSYLSYFDGILTEPVSLNAQNSTIYSGSFPITSTKYVPGIEFSSPKDGHLIATTDATVIGLSYFTTFQSFSEPIIANNNVAFLVADISDTGDSFDGIWRGNNSNLQPIVVKDTSAPSGGEFTSFESPVGPSRTGALCAYIANVTDGSGAVGVYRVLKDGSENMRIAYLGQVAPGFRDTILGGFTQFDLAAANDNGQVVFQASAPGKKGISHSGVWISDTNGENLQLLVMVGQTISVGDTLKTVSSFAFTPITGINNQGQIVFTATFTDRTSAVVIAKAL